MERNDDNLGNLGSSTNAGEGSIGGSAGASGGYGNTGDLTGSAGYGAGAGAGTGGAYGANTGSTGGGTADAGISYGAGAGSMSGAGMEQGSEGLKDRARDLASNAGERLSSAGSTIRDRAGTAKNSLADMLEKGAQRLGSQGESQQLAGATGTGSVAADGTNRLSAIAGGLQTSADWLRETDIDSLRSGIENQVRTNPGRSLLIAAGLGYLLGKALRK